MFNKNLLLVLGAYALGSVINSMYNEKKGKDLKKDMKQAKKDGYDCKRVIIDNFIDTHKNLLDSFKKDVLTKDNISLFNEKKQEAKNVFEEYKKKSEELLNDLKSKGSEFIDSKKDNMLDVYEKGKKNLGKAKDKVVKELKK